jgi:hypothetical protein
MVMRPVKTAQSENKKMHSNKLCEGSSGVNVSGTAMWTDQSAVQSYSSVLFWPHFMLFKKNLTEIITERVDNVVMLY